MNGLKVLDILKLVTEFATAGSVAAPVIFTIVDGIRARLDPSIPPSEVIRLMEEAFKKNHEDKLRQVEEIRATMVGSSDPPPAEG
jgi:hypothetical protein